MASLPAERLIPDYPFAVTGLDYAGPIKVTPSKERKITSNKGYICIFVYFVTRAMLIEIVSDMTAKTFLAAFDRFCNRRGLPKIVYSNNAKTFEGAEGEIRKLFAEKSESFREIKEYVTNLEISWFYSPPYGPHFGGIWKASVKSFKYHYRRVLGESALTFEEHSTLATHIESCLNSHPLCSISLDSRDPIPLTPGHFLIGRPLRNLPPTSNNADTTKTYSQRWTFIMAMRNSF